MTGDTLDVNFTWSGTLHDHVINRFADGYVIIFPDSWSVTLYQVLNRDTLSGKYMEKMEQAHLLPSGAERLRLHEGLKISGLRT